MIEKFADHEPVCSCIDRGLVNCSNLSLLGDRDFEDTMVLLLALVLSLLDVVVALPYDQSQVSVTPYLQDLKKRNGWKYTTNRHHEWIFPENIACSPTGQVTDTLSFDVLKTRTRGATRQIYDSGTKCSKENKVMCFQGNPGEFSNPPTRMRLTNVAKIFLDHYQVNWYTLNFWVEDDVDGIGQRIQFESLLEAGEKSNCEVTSLKWGQQTTGNEDHQIDYKPIDTPKSPN